MRILLAIVASCIVCLASVARAADSGCLPLPDPEVESGDILVTLQSQLDGGESLKVDFDEWVYCVLSQVDSETEGMSGTALRVHAEMDEIAVQATINGVDVWLRLDAAYSNEVILDRATSETLGLTDAEFLGDNSLLEASDFFVEFLDTLVLGDLEIEGVEANIPRLDVPYDHYENRASAQAPAPADGLTVGSVGETVLENLIMILDFSTNRAYFVSVN